MCSGMCSGVCVFCLCFFLFVAPYFLCTVFVSQFDSTCMDRPPLIVCTTHLHTMKKKGGREEGKGKSREGGRGKERGREGGEGEGEWVQREEGKGKERG